MGYLKAIQQGAEEIYETDDDNEVVPGQLPNLARGYYVYDGTNRTAVNPYAYFGYPSIWPRGYPLDQIRPETTADAFSRVAAKPLILQGLADKDPDVDAIFRQACMHLLPALSRDKWSAVSSRIPLLENLKLSSIGIWSSQYQRSLCRSALCSTEY